MKTESFSHLPLISREMSEELFGAGDDPESTAMQREIWAGIRADLDPDLKALAGRPVASLKADLHRIRGYASTAALLRLAAILAAWEEDPGLGESLQPLATDAARDSIAEMEKMFPHLRDVASPKS